MILQRATVGIMLIPQGMAYAMIAGLPVYGFMRPCFLKLFMHLWAHRVNWLLACRYGFSLVAVGWAHCPFLALKSILCWLFSSTFIGAIRC